MKIRLKYRAEKLIPGTQKATIVVDLSGKKQELTYIRVPNYSVT